MERSSSINNNVPQEINLYLQEKKNEHEHDLAKMIWERYNEIKHSES